MKRAKQNRLLSTMALILVLNVFAPRLCAQQQVVDLSMIDGVDLTMDNLFNYQVQSLSPGPVDVSIKGIVQYRSSELRIEYSFKAKLQPGLNTFTREQVHPQFQYSSGALRELFEQYKILPVGTYQYCVNINTPGAEGNGKGVGDCLYRRSEDQFMISLIDPENNAKIYEYNPQLSWVATYTFSDALTYRIRVVEIKEGQNTANALARSNPVYDEKNIIGNSITYPAYAKPLKVFQPYAWTVDAYYKGILLGGAEPWKFTIIEDSLLKALPVASSYIDINVDKGVNTYYAVGDIKLKYTEEDFLQNDIVIKLFRNGKELKKSKALWQVKRGENFKIYDLADFDLRHNDNIEVVIEYKNIKTNRKTQKIVYKYVDPNFIK